MRTMSVTVNKSRQQGFVLIVCLVLLAIVTLLGISTMESSGLEMKMANNNQERQQAFNAAEATLQQVENDLLAVGYSREQLQSGCTGVCFNSSCDGGLCFSGGWGVGEAQDLCQVYTTTAPPTVGPWQDTSLDVWDTSGRYASVNIPGVSNPGKYIVEFHCFIERVGSLGNDVATDSGDIMYRITALGTSDSGQTEALVQSTFRATSP